MLKSYTITQKSGLILGLAIFFFLLINPISAENIVASRTAAIASLMAVLWMTEAIPLGATSLLPVILFPIFGVVDGGEIASQYFTSTIFLFFGGFIIALAMQKWNLHKRISLIIIMAIGKGASRLVLGFMIACAFLSMFISNTATAIMMMPIGLAVAIKIEETLGKSKSRLFAISLMLAIAYSSSVGGFATLVGTPPNLAFHQIYHQTFTNAAEISFGKWLIFGLPLAIIMLSIIWIFLTKILFKQPRDLVIDKNIIKQEYRNLGRISYEEKAVLIIFVLTGLLWIFRADLSLEFITIPGWANLLPKSDFINDGTVAVTMASLLFFIPSKNSSRNTRLIDKTIFQDIPWEIIILFGGGFALAKGFQTSGLSEIVGSQFTSLVNIPPIFLILSICLIITFLTELTSNTATTQTILPILASISVGIGLDPLFMMIPATISASCAFMLPVATPPNAIVFGSGMVKIRDMVRSGIILNLTGAIIITLYFYFIGASIFGISI